MSTIKQTHWPLDFYLIVGIFCILNTTAYRFFEYGYAKVDCHSSNSNQNVASKLYVQASESSQQYLFLELIEILESTTDDNDSDDDDYHIDCNSSQKPLTFHGSSSSNCIITYFYLSLQKRALIPLYLFYQSWKVQTA